MARTSNGKGLLIDIWHWKYQGVESELAANLRGEKDGNDPLSNPEPAKADLVKDQIVPIEVRMLKNFDEENLPRTVKAVEFTVSCKPLGINLQGTDLEVLRQALWAKLEKEFEIHWETYYLVQIAGARSYKGDFEIGFALSQNTIYKGAAKDGTILMREYDRNRTSSPWRYKPWPGEYQDKGGHVLACIPATKENDKAMDEFRARIQELQKRLSDLVKPKNILSTLANLAKVGLPAPSEESKERKDADDEN